MEARLDDRAYPCDHSDDIRFGRIRDGRDHYAGASGFLLKDTEPETLLNSIRTVYQGNAIIAPSATKRLIEKMMDGDFASGDR